MPSSARPRSRAGLTLIEVVAGLALMATILASMLYARTRHASRLATADLELRAVRAADALLTAWRTFPTDASGVVADDPALAWQTTIRTAADARAIRARVGRLTIRRDEREVLSVEVLVPGRLEDK